MLLRLCAAAAMAAILATLTVTIARAMLNPPVLPDIAGRNAFLFQHLLLAMAAASVYQLIFLRHGPPGYAGGAKWGACGFVVVVLAPSLAMPWPTGILPVHDTDILLNWLATAAAAAAGLWLLLHDGGPFRGRAYGRLIGGLLLLLPFLLAPAPERPGEGLSGDIGAGVGNGGNLMLVLGLELLFWLVLGLASVLAARRVMARSAG